MKITDVINDNNLDYSFESGQKAASIIFDNNYIIDFDNRIITNSNFFNGLFKDVDINKVMFSNMNIQTMKVISSLDYQKFNKDDVKKTVSEIELALKKTSKLLNLNKNDVNINRLKNLIDSMNK